MAWFFAPDFPWSSLSSDTNLSISGPSYELSDSDVDGEVNSRLGAEVETRSGAEDDRFSLLSSTLSLDGSSSISLRRCMGLDLTRGDEGWLGARVS